MNDQELDNEVSRALHELFPEPVVDAAFVPEVQGRTWRRPIAISGAASAVLATGLVVGLLQAANHGGGNSLAGADTNGPTTGAGPTATESLTSTAAAPAWAQSCLPTNPSDDLGPAVQYVGLTKAEADRLAERSGDELVFVGGGGRCSGVDDLVYRTHPVAVVYDTAPSIPSGSDGPLPPTARVIAAEHVAPGWAPGQR